MHASYQIIIQVLQLAYTTQACILNLKAYAMQASTWICTYQMQSIKVHELAPPTCVLLLSKNFDLSLFFNVAPFLSMSMSNLYFFELLYLISQPCTISISKLSYLCTISPPLSSISIKGVLFSLMQMYAFGVDGWGLNLAFLWTSLDCWNDTTCRYHL